MPAFGGDVAAGVVDEDIDRTKLSRRRLDHAGDVGAQREIAEHANGPHAMCSGDFFRHRRQRRSLAILRRAIFAHAVDGDIGAEARQPFGERPAKPAACAGDQRNLALQRPGGIICRHDVFS